jgi:hypothetical protein
MGPISILIAVGLIVFLLRNKIGNEGERMGEGGEGTGAFFLFPSDPRVAALPQPWAIIRNPVGIHFGDGGSGPA